MAYEFDPQPVPAPPGAHNKWEVLKTFLSESAEVGQWYAQTVDDKQAALSARNAVYAWNKEQNGQGVTGTTSITETEDGDTVFYFAVVPEAE